MFNHITSHAVERYHSRVDPSASRDEANPVLGCRVSLARGLALVEGLKETA
jgi:hypothetical protein